MVDRLLDIGTRSVIAASFFLGSCGKTDGNTRYEAQWFWSKKWGGAITFVVESYTYNQYHRMSRTLSLDIDPNNMKGVNFGTLDFDYRESETYAQLYHNTPGISIQNYLNFQRKETGQ